MLAKLYLLLNQGGSPNELMYPGHISVSLVPRLLPVFQCYTQKNGGAWYLIARDLRARECPTV